MQFRFIPLVFSLIFLSNCSSLSSLSIYEKPLAGVVVTIDPGHGDTEAYDSFRVGPTGEREEWINLRVAKYLSRKLLKAGATVHLTRQSNKDVSLGGRATLAKMWRSDLLVSIHHNGSGNDPGMDFPIVYFFGPASMNPASVDFAQILIREMREQLTFEQADAGAVYSDHLIYSSGTSILRNTVAHMPGIIGEGGFFTNPDGELRLKSKKYNKLEAEVYFQAIITYFDQGLPKAEPLLPDSLEYIVLTQELQFQLDDGFGGSFFQEDQFQVLQGGQPITVSWNSMEGILTAYPLPSEDHEVVFQVFGRNFKGNAIHPKPFSFPTKRGVTRFSEDSWQDAYKKADSLYSLIDFKQPHSQDINLIDGAIDAFSLSLDIQIVHRKAREAEEKLLELMLLKQELLGEKDTLNVVAQTKRLNEYYPQPDPK